jgi:hypothetical protein
MIEVENVRQEVPTMNDAKTIQILDADGKVVMEIQTNDPEWSFEQYCRNRESVNWSWRVKELA